ncbi:MAG: hypothetical protein AB7G23_21590 [Vicinamibacterales bacterium]
MRPPICEVCDERFDPGAGGLLTFASTPESAAWRARAAAEAGFVGHPPDQGWFCPTHLDAARSLQALPLADAVRQLLATPAVAATGPGGAVGLPCPPTPHDRLHRALLDHLAAFAAAFGCTDLPAPTTSTRRRWHEMDRCVAPDCPYVDEVTTTAATDRLAAEVTCSESWWNPTELASVSIAAAWWEPSGPRTQGTVAAGDSRIEAGTATVTTLLVDLPADTAVQRALAAFLASLDTR